MKTEANKFLRTSAVSMLIVSRLSMSIIGEAQFLLSCFSDKRTCRSPFYFSSCSPKVSQTAYSLNLDFCVVFFTVLKS